MISSSRSVLSHSLATAVALAPLALATCVTKPAPKRFTPAFKSDVACLQRYLAPSGRRAAIDVADTGFTPLSCAPHSAFVSSGSSDLDDDAVAGFHRRYSDEISAIPGVGYQALGLCCIPGVPAAAEQYSGACIVIGLQRCTTPIADVVRRVADLLESAGIRDRRLGIAVQLSALKRPRCPADDPECLPVAYRDARYRPDAPRVPTHRATPHVAPLSGGACARDGECLVTGCGNHCVVWSEASFGAICPTYDALENSQCGCVEGLCTWFEQ